MRRKDIVALVLIIGVWVFIIGFYNHKANYENKNPYNRNFSSEISVEANNHIYRKSDKDFLLNINSKKSIGFFEEKFHSGENSDFEITYLKPETLKKDSVSRYSLPQHSYIDYVSSDKIYYKKGLKFFEYDMNKRNSKLLTSEKVRIFNVFPLNNKLLLCLGNITNPINGENHFSFFIFDSQKLEYIKIIKDLSIEKSNHFLERLLQYSGRFISASDNVVYVCDKFSKIYIFDTSGELTQEVKTIGQVPLPEITFLNGVYTYKKGATFASSSGALVNNNILYVFSCRPWGMKNIMIDEYAIKDGNYVSSYKLDFNGANSNDINTSVQISNDVFVLQIDNYYQGFKIIEE